MKRQIIIVLGFLFCSMLQAQEKQQYLHLTVGGGLHNLSYDLQNGTQSGRFGNTINAGYSYFFTQHWGIQSGLGLQWFYARSTINYLSATPQVDMDGESFELRATYKDWQEKQQALFMDIPLTLQYRHTLSNKISLQGSAGGKISIPITSSYKTTGGSITTTGYYSRLNAELSDLPEYGFTTTTNSYNGKLSLRPSYMAIADLGGLYTLSPKIDLYLGAYVNYGFNNALKADSKEIIQLDGVYNGVLVSTQTNKVTPVSFGLKVGLYLRLGKTKQQTTVDELPVLNQSIELIQKKDSVQTEPTMVVDSVAVTAAKKIELPENVLVEQPSLIALAIQDSIQIKKTNDVATAFTVNYEIKSNQSGNAESEKIKALSDILKANPDISLCLIGHTCNIGSHRVNLRYGMERAIGMKKRFLDQGVPDAQLSVESKAYDEPLVPNNSVENRTKNRRVEIKVFRTIKK